MLDTDGDLLQQDFDLTDDAESETAESRAASPKATAFMLTLEVVAD
jgi:hypothetical protein